MSISFAEARYIVGNALGYEPELTETVLYTAMHTGELSYSTPPRHTGNRTIVIRTDMPPSEESVFDHDEIQEFIEFRRNPKREGAVPPAPTSWPWGDYETKLLRELAAAAERFWTNYDPADPGTAPTSEQVEKWLVDRKMPKRTAQIMAKILRADGLRPGPRK